MEENYDGFSCIKIYTHTVLVDVDYIHTNNNDVNK